MAFTPLSAKNAQVRIGAFVYVARKWVITPTGEELDITNFEGGGFADRLVGILDCEIMVDADYDSQAALSNFNNPPNIVIGAVLSTIKLYLNLTSGTQFWLFPSAIVTTTPMNADVRGKLELSFTAKTKGTFSYPVGT
jgi:hypothetical protein